MGGAEIGLFLTHLAAEQAVAAATRNQALNALEIPHGAFRHLLKFKQEFDWKVFAQEEEKMKRKKLARLFNMAESLNYQLTPKP